MIKVKHYRIYDEYKSLDTESDNTSRRGHIETWEQGKNIIYEIKGDLPEYVNKQLAKIAEEKGYIYWFTGTSYFDEKERNKKFEKMINNITK